ncbi:hypothetical protein A3K86_21500 [Photobacterium jeanii]|uniref:Bile acid:sodium symporter n=1 Tax=Photobacterium jeanii TaxID=858640 RepID=A0A178K2H3_9GAMM|nr:hypothetical protein [Photobacterium jeanii]OAN11508.1 hypothetical protein A3K86_21500 [Photobacterium jeanii]PST91027.1 hypothetical protein C9I91_10605 [Photobacterium jeanii]
MLPFISKHSSLLLMLAAIIGFLFPTASQAFFPILPFILFFLMLFTLLGIKQAALLRQLATLKVWGYALFHAIGLSIISCTIAYLFGASQALLLAISAVSATGSLFATPAIARSIGLDTLNAMAMTIASTLLMPAILYVNLLLIEGNEFSLDMQSYFVRLTIFIAGPMLLSALCHRYVNPDYLHRVHTKLAQFTILLVFAFPFGLVGEFREMFNISALVGLQYLAMGIAICTLFFIAGYFCYRSTGIDNALLAAITAANRNVLLTFTVAGSYLGPEYLALMGAIQLPTYTLPLIVKFIAPRLHQGRLQINQ